MLKKVGLDGFVLALLLMVLLGWLWPQGALEWKGISLAEIGGYGVSLIFFFYGLRLDPVRMKAGLSHWKLHLVIHLSTFLLFPIIVISCAGMFEATEYSDLWLGVFFLAALPSTVSSSVVMVSIARGNIAAAIFNASISSLIGVFLTPLWMSLYLEATDESISLGNTFMKLIFQVLLPVIAGLLLHNRFGALAERNKIKLKYFDQTIILLIVYTSFADSFLNKRFDMLTAGTLLALTACMVALFFLVYIIISGVCRALHFNKEDTIAAVFCGSKKSLIHGTVMSKVLFSTSPLLGVILLPLMIYHAAQLIIASVIARRQSERSELL
jgi:solute carrier family 10 (sodium/bile acid cotransporter), member 7